LQAEQMLVEVRGKGEAASKEKNELGLPAAIPAWTPEEKIHFQSTFVLSVLLDLAYSPRSN